MQNKRLAAMCAVLPAFYGRIGLGKPYALR
jgi:hypothetical protein